MMTENPYNNSLKYALDVMGVAWIGILLRQVVLGRTSRSHQLSILLNKGYV
jgi:hypothetical protein